MLGCESVWTAMDSAFLLQDTKNTNKNGNKDLKMLLSEHKNNRWGFKKEKKLHHSYAKTER